MNNETENTSKISGASCEVAPETNATSADAPEQAQKPTLKQTVCSIIEILEQMKKQISDDGKDYLALSIRSFPDCDIAFSIYSEKADEIWSLPNPSENLEAFKTLDFSENEIAEYLKSKIKTPEQKFKAAIEEKGSELAELKAKLARLEEKEAENA